MLKVMKQKLPLIGDKVFKLSGSPDLETSLINNKEANKYFKEGLGNTIFVFTSGLLILGTLYALSMLFAGVSSVAMGVKSIVDAVLTMSGGLPIIAISGAVPYLAVIKAYQKFTEWEVSKSRAIQEEIVREHAPRFTSNPSLIIRRDAQDPIISEASPIVSFSNASQLIREDVALTVTPELQNVTPDSTAVNERHSLSL